MASLVYSYSHHDEETMAAEDVTNQDPDNAGMELSFAVAPDYNYDNETLLYIDILGRTHHGVYRSYVLGEDSQLESVFFCDRRSQVDYERFGDVLLIDTKYRTNMYKKPLVILSGVNNHYQTTVFACAILNDETTDTYKWVLACLMDAMEHKKPLSVTTDGGLALRNAIESVFPLAQHCLCAWHFCRNLEGKLKLGPDFMKDFMKVMRVRTNPVQWEEDWEAMVHKWRVWGSRWIKKSFTCRYLWAETYLQYSFWAGQTTTSRCESMNSFFNTCSENKPIGVCKGVVRGQAKLRNNERMQHAISDQTDPIFSTSYPQLEKHASKIYTRNIFYKFQEQDTKAANYNLVDVIRDGRENTIVGYILRKGGERRTQLFSYLPADQWAAPSPETVKVNIDGAFNLDTGRSGIGVIIRDHLGEPLAAMAKLCAYQRSAKMVEALAIRDGLVFAMDPGYWNFTIEGDCLSLIEELRRLIEESESVETEDNDDPWGDEVQMLRDSALLSRGSAVQMAYVRRNANTCADVLAKRGSDLGEISYWFDDLPDWALKAAHNDVVALSR